MKRRHKYLSIITVLVSIFFTTCCYAYNSGTPEENAAPVNYLSENGFVNNWLIIGPFPNEKVDESLTPDGAYRLGFHKDYLEVLGGEAKAIISKNTTVTYKDENGNDRVAKTYPLQVDRGTVDFESIFPNMDYKVAYAYSNIYSKKSQLVHFYFGSDDSPKIWANGKLVHELWTDGRGTRPRDDYFTVKLNKGSNSVLIKVEDRWGGWQFILEAFDEKGNEKVLAEARERKKLTEFQNRELRPKGRWDYMFTPGKFPEIVWEKPDKVEKLVGCFPLKVRWFNEKLEEVKRAGRPGRYFVYVEGQRSSGFNIRRALTLYCRPENWRLWEDEIKAYVNYPPNSPIDEKAWDERKETIALNVGYQFIQFLQTEEWGAILMAYFHEMKPLGRELLPTETPAIINNDLHLALKRKLLGITNKYQPLEPPRKLGTKAPVLRTDTAKEAGVKTDAAERIRSVCQEWYQESKEPFVVLVARHGVIIIHEAFGPVELDTPLYMASITKAMTGMMFAQFVNQDLIDLDDPVGKYLPDFPVEGDKVITLRQCFTHTTGLKGHHEWGSVHNPWLDNVILNGIDYLKPGQVYEYNGVGYDLAGKVMELVSGKSILRLMHENFFEPLGVKHTTINDLSGATTSSAEDIARMGQLLLNRGSYGDKMFFSSETFEKLLPRKLNQYYPGIHVELGIGLAWMREKDPDAGKDDIPVDKTILSKNTIGHGAGSSAIFRVDLDNDIVVAQVRNARGKKYQVYFPQFLKAIEDNILKEN